MEKKKDIFGGKTTIFVPTFLLRVNYEQLIENYKQGKYKNITTVEHKINVNAKPVNFESNYSTDQNEPIFTVKTGGGHQKIVATSNVKQYNMFDKFNNEMQMGGTCHWCHCKYDCVTLGIPIQHVKCGSSHIFYMDGMTCSFSCSLAFIRLYRNVDIIYNCSEQLLHSLFSIMHPKNHHYIREAPDFRLHINNGGSLNDEEYRNPKYEYIRTTNIICYPAKIQYDRKATPVVNLD